MKDAGYTKNGAGYWAKGGKELVIKWKENTGNKRRETPRPSSSPSSRSTASIW